LDKGLKMREIWGEEKYWKIVNSLSRKGNPNLPGANKKEVLLIKDGMIKAVFESSQHAAKKLNLHASLIRRVCRGERKTTGGYTFFWAEETEKYIHLLSY